MVDLERFRVVEGWLLIVPRRHCAFTDATTFYENGAWYTSKNERLFRCNKDEIFFRLECSGQDVKDEKKFLVPSTNFFSSRQEEFFTSEGYFKIDQVTAELKKQIKNFDDVVRS